MAIVAPPSANFRAMPRPIPRELPVMSACFPLRDIRVGPRLHELKLRCYRCNLIGTRETFSVMIDRKPFVARDESVSPSPPSRKSGGRDFPCSRYCRYVRGDVDR